MANNYERIQHASVRVKIDPPFVAAQAVLDEAWYGDKNPKTGRSNRATGAKAGRPGRFWRGIEITGEDQFNFLSSLIEARRVVAIVKENNDDGVPYPDLQATGDADDQARLAGARAGGVDIDEILARG